MASSSGNIFVDCAALQQQDGVGGEDATINIMQCVSDTYQDTQDDRDANLRSFLLVVCGGMIFFMQSGFAMMCAGSVRLKNVQNTMLKNLLDACGAALAFYLVGYAFAFGGDLANPESSSRKTFIGYEDFVSVGPNSAFWFFEYTFSATSVTIVAGTLAERCQMAAYLAYSVVLAGFIYPVVAHSVWSESGFLSRSNDDPFMDQGVIDFAGGGVVHLNGGLTALYATLVLGPRRGRFYDAQGEPLTNPQPFPGHSVALQLLGTMILWFGWFGFNPGSALLLAGNDKFGLVAANAAVATALSGASGGITALFTQLYWEERMTGEPKFVIQMAMNGALSGLVAVTSGCAVMEPYAAIVTGIVAGWLYMLSSTLLIKLRIDDAVNAIPVHMVNGFWGLIATGLFASPRMMEQTYVDRGADQHPGFFYSFSNGGADANLFVCQLCAALFIMGWTFVTMFPFFIWLNYRGWLRADSLEELVGLDISYHGRSTHGENGDIKKEYIEAYNRYKGTIRQQRSSHQPGQNNTNPDREQLPFSDPPSYDDNEHKSSTSSPHNNNTAVSSVAQHYMNNTNDAQATITRTASTEQDKITEDSSTKSTTQKESNENLRETEQQLRDNPSFEEDPFLVRGDNE
mmetsp:Transcript_3163/g.6956  ORF Transcript_3163/g.6956 Transcript_3163/m.6956 type:complete len:629 (+) Transcript_3163:670-2556(+)|eukprot:CAMPEP_0201121600 /NCGR_PEP_ID=MMETSP0850-20130426/5450_1 /ASSEMBLY_ACC=CAM_ASM_000622 /TAXON_ID=183588 /ORGANISM="Pseudo-nitzschia fraudulenta, Strain WWA7" /LENGTH=628 /DNA_ID=CAMNT_0047388109 /DNA_START=586 /DNA_END=2472 /DNA_ORIENTATION=+